MLDHNNYSLDNLPHNTDQTLNSSIGGGYMIAKLNAFLLKIVGAILAMLPNSPFKDVIEDLEAVSWLGYVNWFIPIGTLLKIGTAWTAAIAVFYAYQLILRWAKAVGD